MGVVENRIAKLVEDGVFGEVKFVQLKDNKNTEKGVQFASSLLFLNLVVEGPSGEIEFPLVVKLPNLDFGEFSWNGVMFYNEVSMYNKILPALGYNKNQLPKMYYGIASEDGDTKEDIVILENLSSKGFVPSKPKVFLDYDHLSLAIKKIAEFHALSYTLKKENMVNFNELTKLLKEIDDNSAPAQEFEVLKAAALNRGVKAALTKFVPTDLLERCLKLFDNSRELIKLITQPEEPFSVICHGDFCNNNLLFKYSETDEPVDCIFFDFQLSIYSSPVVDLMFFLYMHTTSETREKYWDEILKLYWDTLTENVPSGLPTFQEFIEHIEKRAVYGYLISGWFLPTVLSHDEMVTPETFNLMSFEEKIESFRNMGGEKGEKVVCDIIFHLIKKHYLEKFLDFYDEKSIKMG